MRNDQPSENNTQTQTYECHNQRATKKNVWTWVVIVVNGIFVVLVLIEIFYILLLTCKEIQEVHLKTFHSTLFTLDHTPVFNRNSKGINNHRCNSNNHRSRPWKTISLQKENWQFRDLQSSFRPINPGKGTLLDSCLEFFVSLQNFPSNFTRKLMENISHKLKLTSATIKEQRTKTSGLRRERCKWNFCASCFDEDFLHLITCNETGS